MFSPNQLYDYLRYYIDSNKKNNIVRNFKDGSINPLDLFIHQNNNNTPYVSGLNSEEPIPKFDGFIDMYDQEPIDIHAIKHEYDISSDELKSTRIRTPNISLLSDADFMMAISASMHCPIICHSEKNSNAISILQHNSVIDVHYWAHAIISKFWFSEFKHLQCNRTNAPKRFGVYARDFSGTREYRLDLINELSKIYSNIHYYRPNNTTVGLEKWDTNNDNISSDSSAYIKWTDHEMFDIQIVPETLFDTEKIHLTEKIFKPIVMYQPFIVLSGYGSLKYLRSYGFKTFNSLWDESYDLEKDSNKRFYKIIKLINSINDLSKDEYDKMILKSQEIVEFNRILFYSENFDNNTINELIDGIDNAIIEQEEMFYKKPGGNLFPLMEKLYNTKDDVIPYHHNIINNVMSHCQKNHPKVANDIIKKYNYLF